MLHCLSLAHIAKMQSNSVMVNSAIVKILDILKIAPNFYMMK